MELTTAQKDALARWCAWHIGSPRWAGDIVDVLEDPEQIQATLDAVEAPPMRYDAWN